MLTSIPVRENIDKLIAELQTSLQNATFVKLTIGNYKGEDEHLQRISVRLVETKKGTLLAFQSRFASRDVLKNFEIEQGVEQIRDHFENGFRSAHLFTTENDFQFTIGKKSSRLIKTKPTFKNQPSVSHDREKHQLIDPNAFYLKALGITTEDGRIRSDQRDKWTQINKFVEIVDGLIRNSPLQDKQYLRIVDTGSGKGYLTFALYDFLVRNARGSDRILSSQGGTAAVIERAIASLSITGVEQRPDLVALCNDVAKASGFDGLKFVQGTIALFEPGDVDILIALHACDTATDDALYKGITSNSSIIVAAPCCHHELKKQVNPPELLSGLLKHPILLERTAETLTDGIRSLLLEAHGYRTKMFEFVATEHTPKNNMLVATRTSSSDVGSPHASKGIRASKRVEVDAIMSEFGIAHHHLADLIERGEQNDAVRRKVAR